MGDFSGILIAVLLVAGAILLIDFALYRPRRRAAADAAVADTPVAEPWLVVQARSLFPVLLIVLLFRSFLFEPFRIPSESMMPGLVDGDFIVVSKFSYDLRLPLLNTKLASIGEPRRGDVIVFRHPSDPSTNLIKRLVGLPGDHIVVQDNRLTVNGAAVPLASAGVYSGGYGFSGSELGKERFGATDHMLMFAGGRFATDFEGTVPPGHYFFMGDNRNDSDDSRFPDVGFVPRENLIGHALRIWMNWQIPGWPHWGRVGTKIQ